jgi:MEMO1 family protein
MKLSGTREAGKAGSWYEEDPEVLSQQLDRFLDAVAEPVHDSDTPISGAKAIIAPYVLMLRPS